MKILFGLVDTKPPVCGHHTCNVRMIEALKDKVDIHLIAGDSGDPNDLHRPGVHWGTLYGLPTLFAKKNDALINRFTAPGDNREIDEFIDRMADALEEKGIDIVNIMEWEEELGISIFAAARKAHIPYIMSPVDYRLACGEAWLFEKGAQQCSGPDGSFKKCSRCMATVRHILRSPYTEVMAVVKDTLYSVGLTGFLRHYVSPEQWKKRFNTINEHVKSSAAIVTFSSFHADKMKDLLGISSSQFKVIPAAIRKPSEDYSPSPDRFKPPLRFIWVNTIRREWGFYFVLDAWKKAGVSPKKAQLHLFTKPGFPPYIRQSGFGSLLDDGSIVERHEIVLGHEEEIYRDFAAKICTALWPENGWNQESYTLKLPGIYPDKGANDEVFVDGISGFFYKRADIDSLVNLIRRLIDNPSLLEEAAGRYHFSGEYSIEAMGEKYLDLYESILSKKPEI